MLEFVLNPSNWDCCKHFSCCTNKKYFSLIGMASIFILPCSYYLYRIFKTQNKKKHDEMQKPNNEIIHNYERIFNEKNAENTINSFPIIYNFDDKSINFQTIKKVFYLAIIFCQDDLALLRRRIHIMRRKLFANLEKYTEMTLFLYHEYYNILNNSLQKLLKIKKIERETFEQSVLLNESKGMLRKGFLRDAAWSVLSEKIGIIEKLPREKMKEYLLTQIKDLKIQKKICNEFLINKEPNIRKIILTNRVDDLSFEKLGIEEVDYVKSLKYYINDEEIKKIIAERNFLLLDDK